MKQQAKTADILKYEENEVYLLKSGMFILITDVAPITPLHPDDSTRIIHFIRGIMKTDQNTFVQHGQNATVSIDNPMSSQQILFYPNRSGQMTIAELKNLEVSYIGKLRTEKRALISKISSGM